MEESSSSIRMPVVEKSRAALVPPDDAEPLSSWPGLGGCRKETPLALADASVKVGMAIQLGLVVTARRVAHALFVQAALRITDPDVPLPTGQLSSQRCAFKRLWSLSVVGRRA